MNATAHYALLAAIVAGVLGALIVCVLAYAYGFRVDDGQPAALRRRRRITRLGHGLAGVSFALAAVAVVVGLLASSRASAHVESRFRTLHVRVDDLVVTLHRIGEAAERLQRRWSAFVLSSSREEPETARTEPRASPAARRTVVGRSPSTDGGPGGSAVAGDDDVVHASADAPKRELPAPRERAPAREKAAGALPAPGDAVTPRAPPRTDAVPREEVFPPRVTPPPGRPLPRETVTGTAGAIPRPPESRPVVRFERVEPPRPPAEPAPRVPSVVEVPKTPEIEIVPPPPVPAAPPRSLGPVLPRPPRADERAERLEQERLQPLAQPERRQRRDDAERPDTSERRPERLERLERHERAERPERRERHERAERIERQERPERIERRERRERPERPERVERRERHERRERIERPTRRDD